MGRKEEKTDIKETYEFRELKLYLTEGPERDPDAKIEEYWIEAIDSSDDGYWTLVGRRYGVFQLYDWQGKLHRLPARPPSQSVTDIVFNGKYLGIVASPYLAIYYLNKPKEPSSWKTVRISQEGLRPTGGLDIRNGTLAFGVVGEKVYTIDLAGDLSQETVDFKSTFIYRDSEIGDLKVIKILPSGKLALGGTQGTAIYSIGGNLLKRLDYAPSRALVNVEDKLYIADNALKKVVIYDPNLDNVERELPLENDVSTMDVSPDGRFLFTADLEENRLGIYSLESMELLGFIEGYGYSVVEVSPDGSIYTSRYEDLEDNRLYYLEKFETNLIDYIYPAERQKQIVKNAEKLYREFTKKLKGALTEEELPGIKEFSELDSIDIPLRRVRELINEARSKLRDRAYEIFLESVSKKLNEGSITGEDYKEIESRIEGADETWKPKLEELRDKVSEYFSKELDKHLNRVRETIKGTSTTDIRDLEALEEVKEARSFISKLPRDLYNPALEQLVRVLQGKLIEDRLRTFAIELYQDSVRFGREEFPRLEFKPVRLRWRIKVEDKVLQEGKVFGKLVFEREDGVLAEPKRYNNILTQEELRHFPYWVNRYLRHLNGLCSVERPRVPEFVSYEETPWFVQNLERFTSLVKEQLDYEEGILILEGDAGVGKNFLVEVFSALTNRPLFIVPCNSKMEKEDITFIYEFDPKRGTKRVYSDLVKALRTPGAVIYLDEINTLPPSLVKIFNPLFDYRRYLVLSYGEVVKARPDVIIVGGMNPQNYLGVSELPQDIKTRADVLYVDYPPFQDDKGFYYPDEAIILKDYMEEVAPLNKEDFTCLWYLVVNDVRTVKGEELRTPEREREITLLFDLLKIANGIRKAYRDYQTQQSEEPVEFVFSIRDTIRCARRLKKYGDAKTTVVETIIPKISSPLEKEIVKSIVERV
ncbi:AAA family ATPase [Hydrogenivirga sp. 128-5-R1-1]|uniref:AAA family ATPase n=1 Tax=Hydrogenivirga sp. 128-5-R1-1 TaxID=392423 RepID=UPI001E4CC67D|nr:AAA family ATPase [Hydrogenivirga sp. 128-5-R1-1]